VLTNRFGQTAKHPTPQAFFSTDEETNPRRD
jgi:hypothetical protein